MAGPPPRAWRAPALPGGESWSARTTSTCVESTCPGPRAARSTPDHLHVRGEHFYVKTWRNNDGGPPPRAWRAPEPHEQERAIARTTSTCVESTAGVAPESRNRPDHLHVRGEHQGLPPHAPGFHGPPPRAWRARSSTLSSTAAIRTTSTCVESTRDLAAASRLVPDHLHVRGEHSVSCHCTTRPSGPPPRAWRAPTELELSDMVSPDHLHVRGEHARQARRPSRPGGPPPRAWRARGSEPVHAALVLDHLHVRGEHGYLAEIARVSFWTTSTCVESTPCWSDPGARCPGPPPRAWRARRRDRP